MGVLSTFPTSGWLEDSAKESPWACKQDTILVMTEQKHRRLGSYLWSIFICAIMLEINKHVNVKSIFSFILLYHLSLYTEL